jgi:hypothetical protein
VSDYYTKMNQVKVTIKIEALLRILASADHDVPKGLPANVYLSVFDNTLELTWDDPKPPCPF